MDIRECLRSGKNIYDLELRVVYYARVSTLNELQSTSIVNQIDYFIKYIENIPKWVFVGGYVDYGLSGKMVEKRENFLRMIDDGKKGKFDFVLTKSVSRFARNTIDSIKYTSILLKYGIGVMFINDNINTMYSDSEFRLTLMASIAQDELRKLSESVKFGLNQSINRGVVLGSSNIYGYCKENGKLVIDKEEERIVRDIYGLFLKGIYNYSKISRVIRDKYGKKMDCNTVKRILTNYKYKGYYCGRKSEVVDYKSSKRKMFDSSKWVIYKDNSRVPPIIEESVWDYVNQIIESMENKKRIKYEVFCVLHNKRAVVKKKRYKDRYYFYFSCDCFKISSMLLDRIDRVKKIDRVYVIFSEVLILKVRCQY